ncbi:MAG: nicotinate-nucleotide adenylyltransferase [Terriglobales bacterium]
MIEIGVMGGTFNPIHGRQLMVAQCALDQFGLAKVIFVPNGTPPHKQNDVLDRQSRFELVVAATKDNPLFEASRIEIDRPGVTWTIDTLKQLQAELGPDVRLNFIIGEDNIKSFQNYDRRLEFFQLCRLLVSPRDFVRPGLVDEWRAALADARIEMIDCPADSRSSTLIRQWIRAGRSVRYLVSPAVYELLVEKQYYVDNPAPRPEKLPRLLHWIGKTISRIRARNKPAA